MSTNDIDPQAVGQDVPDFAEQRPSRGWWRGNWRWFVPAFLLAIILLGGGAAYWALIGRVRCLDVYRTAMQTIQADQELQRKLGQPIQAVNWPPRSALPGYSIGERELDIRWDIQGPIGQGKAHVQAKLMAGRWEIAILEVGGKRVSLPESGNTEADAPPFNAPKSENKKPESNGPPPEINLALPPNDGPGNP